MRYHRWSSARAADHRIYEGQVRDRLNMPRFNQANNYHQQQQGPHNFRHGMRQQRNFYNGDDQQQGPLPLPLPLPLPPPLTPPPPPPSRPENHDSSNETSNGHQETQSEAVGNGNESSGNNDGTFRSGTTATGTGGVGGNGYRNIFTRHRIAQVGAFRGNFQPRNSRVFTRSTHNTSGAYIPGLLYYHRGSGGNSFDNHIHVPLYSDVAGEAFPREGYINNGCSHGDEPFAQQLAAGYIAPNVGYMGVPRFRTPINFISNQSFPTNGNFGMPRSPGLCSLSNNDGSGDTLDIQSDSFNRLDDFPSLSSTVRSRNTNNNRGTTQKSKDNKTEKMHQQQQQQQHSGTMKSQSEQSNAEKINSYHEESNHKKIIEQSQQNNFEQKMQQNSQNSQKHEQQEQYRQQQQQQQQQQHQHQHHVQVYQQHQQFQNHVQQRAFMQHMQQQTGKPNHEYSQKQQQQHRTQQQDQFQQQYQAQCNVNNQMYQQQQSEHQSNFHQNSTKPFQNHRSKQQQHQLYQQHQREFQQLQQHHKQQQQSFMHYQQQQQRSQHQFQHSQHQQYRRCQGQNFQRQQGQIQRSNSCHNNSSQHGNLKQHNSQLQITNQQRQSTRSAGQQYSTMSKKHHAIDSQNIDDECIQEQKSKGMVTQSGEFPALTPKHRKKYSKTTPISGSVKSSSSVKYRDSQCQTYLLNFQLKTYVKMIDKAQQTDETSFQQDTFIAEEMQQQQKNIDSNRDLQRKYIQQVDQDIDESSPSRTKRFSLDNFPALPRRSHLSQMPMIQSVENIPQGYLFCHQSRYEQEQKQLRDTFSSILISSDSQGSPIEDPPPAKPPIFKMRSEDFPALPSTKSRTSDSSSFTTKSSDTTQTTVKTVIAAPKTTIDHRPIIDAKDVSSFLASFEKRRSVRKDANETIGHKSKIYKPLKTTIKVWPNGLVTNIPATMLTNQYGIVGLYSAMKAAETNPFIAQMMYGIDLETLGLDLRSKDPLLPKFKGPFADESHQEPYTEEFMLFPSKNQDIKINGNSAINSEYLRNYEFNSEVREFLAPPDMEILSDDDLFYLFYTCVQDLLQLQAANELYNRAWVFYIKDKIWITHDPERTYQQNGHFERGYYICYDHVEAKCLLKFMKIDTAQIDDRPNIPKIHRDNFNSSSNWSSS